MVIEYIRYEIPAARAGEFGAAYATAQSALQSSEHCLAYELSRGVEEPQHYILQIDWDSLEGHEHGFRTSLEFGPFLAAVQPFLSEVAEMRHYEATAVRSDAAVGVGR
jgi:quinol monooxygenase YgiN